MTASTNSDLNSFGIVIRGLEPDSDLRDFSFALFAENGDALGRRVNVAFLRSATQMTASRRWSGRLNTDIRAINRVEVTIKDALGQQSEETSANIVEPALADAGGAVFHIGQSMSARKVQGALTVPVSAIPFA